MSFETYVILDHYTAHGIVNLFPTALIFIRIKFSMASNLTKVDWHCVFMVVLVLVRITMQTSLFEDVDKCQHSKQNCYISETAMGKKIYAQSNHDSEYVRSVYR